MEKIYAKALYDLAQKEGTNAHELVMQLEAHLKSVGRSKLLPAILLELQRLEAREAKLISRVEVAHQKDAAQALKDAAAKGIHATHADVNPDLIQGWRAMGNGKLVDQTGKRALIELYQSITAQ